MNIFRGLMYCRNCGSRASTSGASFIKNLARSCQAPGTYGIENLKRLQQGILPHNVKQWPIDSIVDSSGATIDRINAAPLSDFEQQVSQDHPELSVAESKVVASMLLKCAEFTARISSRNPVTKPGISQ